jgi:thiol-disulfide isomerase/thioredoxin
VSTRKLLLVGGILLLVSAGWIGGRALQQSLGANRADKAPLTLRFFSNPATVPILTVRDLDGRTITSDAWRGKVTIVNFWATWCPPCRAEIPDLIALQDKYRDQIQIVGISQDETGVDQVKRFANEQHLNYPVVMSTPALEGLFPGIYALPTSFVIDRDLKIVQKHVGMLNAATIEAEIRSLAGLHVDAVVERVEETDETKQMIKDAAQATKIPGINLDGLSAKAKAVALGRLNTETCTCGCRLTLAACRINDPTCSISLPIAQKVAAGSR